ncbi:paired amphipathic helix [Cladochytrium replicatum]|nr:paired amphipathic helix [Cladochytrium replicatum]
MATETTTDPPFIFMDAILYLSEIKNRYNDNDETYQQFLTLMEDFQAGKKTILEVKTTVLWIFKDNPDLIYQFKQFLPDNEQHNFP